MARTIRSRLSSVAIPAVVLFVLAGAVTAQAQQVDREMIQKMRAEGTDRSAVLEIFNTLTNVIGPRLAGSPAYNEAAAFARSRFEVWGLANPRLEPFEFGRGWTLEKLTLELVEPRYFPLIGYPRAWMPSTAGEVVGSPVYVGESSADEIRAMGDRLRGAIVLAYPPQPGFITDDRPQPANVDDAATGAPRGVRSQPAAGRDLNMLLEQAGAAVVLEPNQGQHGTIFVLGNRNTPDDAVPTIVLAAEHYNMLVRLTQSEKPVTVRADLRVRYHEADRNTYNVIAEIPGTDPAVADQIVLLGAHLDSWHSSTGATDNADGAAEVMEAMRILMAVGARPRRTIRVALWGAEEEGLLGSRAYVAQHLEGEANAANRDRHYLYLNDDPGAGPVYGWYMQDNAAMKQIFDTWLAPLADLGVKRNVIAGIGSTDHVSFNAVGVPGFNTIKDYVDYDVRTHHTNADFYERLNEHDLEQSAIVLAVFALNAAMREGPLPAASSTRD